MPPIRTLPNGLFPISFVYCVCCLAFVLSYGYHRKANRGLLVYPPSRILSGFQQSEKYQTFIRIVSVLFFLVFLFAYFTAFSELGFINAIKKLFIVLGLTFIFSSLGLTPVGLGILSLKAIWFSLQKKRSLLRISSLPIFDRDRSFLTKALTIYFAISSFIFTGGLLVEMLNPSARITIPLFITGIGLILFAMSFLWNHVLEANYGLTLSTEGVAFGITDIFKWRHLVSYSLTENESLVKFKAVYKIDSSSSQYQFFVAILKSFHAELKEILLQNSIEETSEILTK